MIEVNEHNAGDVATVTKALSAPFDPAEVKWKPQSVKGNRALAMAFIDARLVMDRLDAVVGVEGWQDDYDLCPDGSVVCRLSVRIGGEWLKKVDVGSPSEQPDGGDRLKAAFSDALKRAAVKFGVGRYLYRLHAQWVDYDPVRKQFASTPTLPAFALPKDYKPSPAQRQLAQIEAARQTANQLPADGKELENRLASHEAKLVRDGVCEVGDLLNHVRFMGVQRRYSPNLAEWSGPAIPFAVEAVKEFESSRRKVPAGGAK